MRERIRKPKTFITETIGEYIAKGRNAHREEVQAVKAAKICREVGYDDTYRMTAMVVYYGSEVYHLLKDDIAKAPLDKRDFVWLCNRLDRRQRSSHEAGRKWRNKRLCYLASAEAAVSESYVAAIAQDDGDRFDEVLFNPVTGNYFMFGYHSSKEQ